MRNPWAPLLALAAASQAALALEVVHDPVSCTAPDRYVRIAAQGTPAGGRRLRGGPVPPGPTIDWYRVRMTAQRRPVERALLPRPAASLARFEYRVALTGSGTDTVTTPPFAVAVAPTARASRATRSRAAIVVQVPPGAPAIPPVPPGFSPVGTVAAQAAPAGKGWSGAKLAGDRRRAGRGRGRHRDRVGGERVPPLDVPGFRFDRTMPLRARPSPSRAGIACRS